MKAIYKKMKAFMLDYFDAYSRYANDAETMHKMDDYWTPDFRAVAYFRRSDGTYPVVYSSRKEFQEFLIRTHQVVKDSMNPIDFVIDEKAKKVGSLLKIIKTNQQTGEKVEIDAMGCYHLVPADRNTFQIKSLDFFWEAPEAIKNLGNS